MGSASETKAYHHGNLREALVETSLEILERDGVAGLGLRAAARAAGVSQTAPYHHFDGKEGLLAAVAALGFREQKGEQQRIAEESARLGRSAADAVLELGVGYVRFARKSPELFKLMFGPEISDRSKHPELAEAYAAAYTSIEDATRERMIELRGEAPPEDLVVEVASAWSTVHGLATLLIDGRLRPGESAMPEEDELVRRVIGRFSSTLVNGP